MHDFFRGLALFAEFTAPELDKVAELAAIRRFATGELVIHQGDKPNALFLIRDGAMRITWLADDKTHEEVLTVLGAGDTFGELSLIDQQLPALSVVAEEPSVVYAIDHQELRALMKLDPVIANKILWSLARTLVHRLRETNQSLAFARMLIQQPARES